MRTRHRRWIAGLMLSSTVAVAGQGPPRLPYDDFGACPFECCTYREWTVKADTDTLVSRGADARIAFRVLRGTTVRGVTGVVVTTRFGRAVAKRQTTIGRHDFAVKPGEEVSLLHYLGEGHWKYWLHGQIDEEFIPDPENCDHGADRRVGSSDECAVQVEERPRTNWWVLIRNRDGREGWTREVNHFGNIDACGSPSPEE